MSLNLLYTELLKYRKSLLPLIIIAGSFFPVLVAFLMNLLTDPGTGWDVIFISALNYMNLLALILSAVFVSYIYMEEFQGKTISILFSYPVSRFRLYAIKLDVLFLMLFALYFAFNLTTVGLGLIFIKQDLSAAMLLKFVKFSTYMVLTNFALVPLTVLAGLLGKGISAPMTAGMCYVLVNFSFAYSDAGIFIPVCIPGAIASKYFNGNSDTSAILSISTVCCATFIVTFILSSLYYVKADIDR